jgi:hypothetical protein
MLMVGGAEMKQAEKERKAEQLQGRGKKKRRDEVWVV